MLDDDAQRAAFAPDHAPATPGSGWPTGAHSMVFLTRLPLSRGNRPAPRPHCHCRSHAGVSRGGAVVGAIVGAVLVLATWLGAPAAVAAPSPWRPACCLTGALHEDGLADTADGFGGGATAERKLEIMRDSHIGTYGVLALIAGLALKAVAIATLAATSVWLAAAVIVAAAAVSRVAPVGLLHLLVPARRDGLSAEAGRPGRATVVQALALATLISVVVLWPHSFFFGLVFVPLAGLVGLLGIVLSLARPRSTARPATWPAPARW
jgi:adenosylcobinamide-GDP ribazoletransferase